MINGEFKNILLEIFDVLEFSEEEKNNGIENFKKKTAFGVLNVLKSDLNSEHQDWIKNHGGTMNQSDPVILEIQEEVKSKNSSDELYNKSKAVFKKVLIEYVNFMSADLEPEKIVKLNNILAKV